MVWDFFPKQRMFGNKTVKGDVHNPYTRHATRGSLCVTMLSGWAKKVSFAKTKDILGR